MQDCSRTPQGGPPMAPCTHMYRPHRSAFLPPPRTARIAFSRCRFPMYPFGHIVSLISSTTHRGAGAPVDSGRAAPQARRDAAASSMRSEVVRRRGCRRGAALR